MGKIVLLLLLSIPCFGQVVTNSASYEVGVVAPNSIATLFADLRNIAPTTLTIGDKQARIIYTDPLQINFIVPDVPLGLQRVSYGPIQTNVTIESTAPGIFTVNQSGTGLPAAQLTYDGINVYPLIPVPFNDPRPIYLTLYCTGIRNNRNIPVYLGGSVFSTTYVGPQYQYEGLDQINILLPPELAGAGKTTIQVGNSNLCEIEFGGKVSPGWHRKCQTL